jgi:hypothetical protein
LRRARDVSMQYRRHYKQNKRRVKALVLPAVVTTTSVLSEEGGTSSEQGARTAQYFCSRSYLQQSEHVDRGVALARSRQTRCKSAFLRALERENFATEAACEVI